MEGSPELERSLGDTTGTVTAFLERLVGEPVDADVGLHVATVAAPGNALRVAEGRPLLARSAHLTGRRTARPYVYAESLIDPGPLPDDVRRRLATSRDPIGRILVDRGMVVSREPVEGPVGVVSPAPPARALAAGDHLLARSYRLGIEGVPVMVITEWFLPSLQPFLTGG
jgi:chorismate-pyruvate lyase